MKKSYIFGIVVVIIAIGVSALFLKAKIDNEQEMKRVKEIEEYNTTARSIVADIETGLGECSNLAGGYLSVWGSIINNGSIGPGSLAKITDSTGGYICEIWEKIDSLSYRTGVLLYKYQITDFNIALAIMQQIIGEKDGYKLLDELNTRIDKNIKEIANPLDTRRGIYDEIISLYAKYKKIAEKSKVPEGSYDSYAEFFSNDFSNIDEMLTTINAKLP